MREFFEGLVFCGVVMAMTVAWAVIAQNGLNEIIRIFRLHLGM